MSGARRPGASLWPGSPPTGRASGPEVGGRLHPNPRRCLWAGDEGRFLVGPAQGHGREKDRTGQAGQAGQGRRGVVWGCLCLLSTHLWATEMRPQSSTLPCPRTPGRAPGASGQMQARQGQWGTMGGALQERVWTETQERG